MGGLSVLAIALLGLTALSAHALAPSGAHASAAAIPAWLPALARPVATPAPAPLRLDWLAQHPAPDLDVHAGGAVLLDLDTNEVLWARDPHGARPPASLTKLVTVMVAADLASSLDQEVTVPPEAVQLDPDSTMMGLTPGEAVTVRDLMYGVFLVSGNDAAETLARTLGGGRDRFIQLMNQKAAALGMTDSRFSNPTGLDDPGLRASPYDLAIAAAAIARRYPNLMPISGTLEEDIPATPAHGAYFLHSLIKLLTVYPGATGLKSGYTDDAGYCLVGTATRGGRHLAVVLLHSDLSLTVDAAHLLDYGFGLPDPEPLDPAVFPQL